MGKTAILVLAEVDGGRAVPLTREILGLARKVAFELDAGVAAVFMAPHENAAADLIAHGADRVYFCEHETSEESEGESWLRCIEPIARDTRPLAILMGHTPTGADLAPRLAFRLESAVATGCVGVAVEAGRMLFTRPCYGGNVRETLSLTTPPAIATIRAGVGTPDSDPAREGEVHRITRQTVKPRTRVVAREREAADAKRLEDASIVVAGGRGLEGPEGFRVLENFAAVIGGVVGSSRVPCDLGWCPHSWQIGLTGKTVTPDLYFAVGISGAGHHMAGCGNAKTIVAINTDPEAAIFREARFGVIGDYRKIIPALAGAVATLRQEQTTRD